MNTTAGMKAKLANQSGAARAKISFVALGRNGICDSCRIAIQPQTLKEGSKISKAGLLFKL